MTMVAEGGNGKRHAGNGRSSRRGKNTTILRAALQRPVLVPDAPADREVLLWCGLTPQEKTTRGET